MTDYDLGLPGKRRMEFGDGLRFAIACEEKDELSPANSQSVTDLRDSGWWVVGGAWPMVGGALRFAGSLLAAQYSLSTFPRSLRLQWSEKSTWDFNRVRYIRPYRRGQRSLVCGFWLLVLQLQPDQRIETRN